MDYTGMSPFRLLEEAERLGWQVIRSGRCDLRLIPKPPSDLPPDLADALWRERVAIRTLLVLRGRERA
jgi:hypothetical protein